MALYLGSKKVKLNLNGCTYKTNIYSEIPTVTALPSNGYIGARVIKDGSLYVYNGKEWKAV